MSKRAEDLKNAIAERAIARNQPEEIEELPDLEPEEELTPFEEEEPAFEDVEAQAALAHEAGYEQYLQGTDVQDNPFLQEDIVEDFSEAEALLLTEAWNDGWVAAHRDFLFSQLILASKRLVTEDDVDRAGALLEDLEGFLSSLEQVLDMEQYEEFWGYAGAVE